MPITFNIIDSDEIFSENETVAVTACLEAAAITIRTFLPDIPNLQINISVAEENCAADLPVQAMAAAPGEIWIMLDPNYPAYKLPNQHKFIETALAHEWHHDIRGRGVGYGKTLGEVLVSEGLAQKFEEQITGEPSSLGVAVADAELLAFEDRIKKLLRRKNYGHAEMFHGNPGKYPRWFGYSFSYALVDAGLDYKNLTAAQAVNIDPTQIIELWLKGDLSIVRSNKRKKTSPHIYDTKLGNT